MAVRAGVVNTEAPDEPADPVGPAPDRRAWVRVAYVIAGLVALIPAARMIDIVLDGSRLQHADYWAMLDRITNSGGGLDIGGLFHFQNEHPVVIAQLLYWLNVHAFAGSNITLGLVVVGLVLGQLAVVALLLRGSALGPLQRIAIFVLASALLFDLTGTWSFSKAMSGTAWLSANLFAFVAVYLRSRDRRGAAFAVAIVAGIAYGTGLMAWPAVIATGVSRRPLREFWREWPYAVGFLVNYGWYRIAAHPGAGEWSDPMRIVRGAANMFGFVLGIHGRPGLWLGYVVLLGVPVLVVALGGFFPARGVAGWVGIATFGWLATFEVFSGRATFVLYFGEQNRYTSQVAITLLGFVALVLFACNGAARRFARRRANISGAEPTDNAPKWASIGSAMVTLLVVVPLLVGAWTAGRAHADDMLALNSSQELGEVALRYGMTDNTRFLLGALGAGRKAAATKLLRDLGHYPFVDNWDLDCGLQGKRLGTGARSVQTLSGGVLSGDPAPLLPGAVQITGHVDTDRHIHCIVVTNAGNVVIGAATIGVDDIAAPGKPQPSGTGFRALARRESGTYRVYVVFKGDETPAFLDQIPASDIAAP
jgi:hypothetical protein